MWHSQLFLCMMLGLVGCGKQSSPQEIFQTSTIDALLSGVYDGDLSVAQLLKHGDLGLGTFDALDGEMVVLDGQCYQVTSDGKVGKADPRQLTPFATVCRFGPELSFQIHEKTSSAQVQQMIDARATNPNLFYAIKLTGTFETVHTRSVPRQIKPYPPLKQVTAQQPEFQLGATEGVIVGFRCPAFVKGLNVTGYHLHFLNQDRTAGGHLLDYTLIKGTCQIDAVSHYSLRLPAAETFAQADLVRDRSAEIDQVEKAYHHKPAPSPAP